MRGRGLGSGLVLWCRGRGWGVGLLAGDEEWAGNGRIGMGSVSLSDCVSMRPGGWRGGERRFRRLPHGLKEKEEAEAARCHTRGPRATGLRQPQPTARPSPEVIQSPLEGPLRLRSELAS